MNGRVDDPAIGRFLSADPFVQAPMVTQNFNRYSYVMNNPLSFSDPTGFNIFGDFFNWLNETIGSTATQVIVAVAAIAIGYVTAGAATAIIQVAFNTVLQGFYGAVVAGAGFGFGSGFSSVIMTGGSLGQAFQAGAIGALIGGISGGIAYDIGSAFPSSGRGFIADMFSFNHLGRAIGHAILGGAANAAEGGDWEEGAISGGVSEAFTPAIDYIGNGSPESGTKRDVLQLRR